MLIPYLAGWILWCVLHSLLISESWIALWNRHAGRLAKWHRLLYVSFSVVSLIVLLGYHREVPTSTVFHWVLPWSFLQWGGLATAVAIFWMAGRQYDQAVFFGFAQLRKRQAKTIGHDDELTTTGILGRMRHPYYTASFLLLIFLGNPTVTDLYVRGILASYLILGTLLEERKLVRILGNRYIEYRKTTPMFIPRFPFRGSSKG